MAARPRPPTPRRAFAGADFPEALDPGQRRACRRASSTISRFAAFTRVVGGSMGAQQALQWAVSHPDRVERVVALVGNARTTLYAQIFLNAVALALKSDPAFEDGRYRAPPLLGLSRMAEVVGGLCHLAALLLDRLHLRQPDMDGTTLEGFLAKWRPRYHGKDANDLLCQLDAWMRHDIAGTPDCRGRSRRGRLAGEPCRSCSCRDPATSISIRRTSSTRPALSECPRRDHRKPRRPRRGLRTRGAGPGRHRAGRRPLPRRGPQRGRSSSRHPAPRLI